MVFEANDSDSDSDSILHDYVTMWLCDMIWYDWLYDMICSSLEERMSVWVKEWRNTEYDFFMCIESMLHERE